MSPSAFRPLEFKARKKTLRDSRALHDFTRVCRQMEILDDRTGLVRTLGAMPSKTGDTGGSQVERPAQKGKR